MTEIDENANTPPDPAFEQIRRKMVRLLAVSVGTLILGVMAVLAAVVYRTGDGGRESVSSEPVPLVVPYSGEILETNLDGDRLMLRLRNEGEELLVFDRRTGELLSRHPIVGP